MVTKTMTKRGDPMPDYGPLVPMKESFQALGISYRKLRRLAVEEGEFTTVRDVAAQGSEVFLYRDECEAYRVGRLPGLREFRKKAKRNGKAKAS